MLKYPVFTQLCPYVLTSVFRLIRFLQSFLSPTAFGIACKYFAHFEEQGVGAQWYNLNSSPMVGDEFSVGGAMFMLIVDAVVYGLLTWYIEAVFPGMWLCICMVFAGMWLRNYSRNIA